MNFLPIPSAMMPAPLFLRESMIWVFSEFRGLSGDFGSDVNPESRTVSRLGGAGVDGGQKVYRKGVQLAVWRWIRFGHTGLNRMAA
jgi:hypothetical protein